MTCLRGILLLLFFGLQTAGFSYADIDKCLGELGKGEKQIKTALENNGNLFINFCSTELPYLFVAITNLDNSKNRVSVTHLPRVEHSGFPLATIDKHAVRENAVIAINGSPWDGDKGFWLPTRLDLDTNANYPLGTVRSKGTVINERKSGGETTIGFSERSSDGTGAKFFDIKNGDQLLKPFTHNVDSTTTTLLKGGLVANNLDTCSKPEICSGPTSSMGIGRYNEMDVLVLISFNHQSLNIFDGLSDVDMSYNNHIKIFKKLGVTDAIRLDWSSATSLYINGV